MLVVEKAIASDFEEVFELLVKFTQVPTPKEVWKRLFTNHWHGDEDYFGYVLRDHDKIVGYMGLIFSKRNINGVEHKFCDMTSWIVKEEYRHESLRLLTPVLALKGYTFTNLSASDAVFKIMKAMRFMDLESKLLIFYPKVRSLIAAMNQGVSVTFDPQKIAEKLNANELKLFQDHRPLGCVFGLITSPASQCFMIGHITKRKHIPLLRLHYVSNANVLGDCLGACFPSIILKHGVIGVIVDERFMRGKIAGGVHVSERPTRKLFKSSTLTKDDIDSLYSEHVVLKI